MKSFRELSVWQRSRDLAKTVHELTAGYPTSERFGLSAQTRRSVVSISSNIAEGCGRRGSREFSRFIDIALGSAYELESQLLIAADLGFAATENLKPLLKELDEVKRMLVGLVRALHAQGNELHQ